MNKNNNPYLTTFSQELRTHMTKEEKHLWYDFFKKISYTVNRQKVVGNYILDFYCDEAKIAIELDGSQHYEEREEGKDRIRDKHLEERGLKILRFSNYDLHKNFKGICEYIYQMVYARISKD